MPCEGQLDAELVQGLLDKINSSCFYGDREDNLVLFLNNRKPVENNTDEFQPEVLLELLILNEYEFDINKFLIIALLC